MMVTENNNIILFDGFCNLCHSTVGFIMRKDVNAQFQYISLQSEKGKELLKENYLPEDFTSSVLYIKSGKLFSQSNAILEILKELPSNWKHLHKLKFLPINFRDMIYNFIANNRYNWFGKRNSCDISMLQNKNIQR